MNALYQLPQTLGIFNIKSSFRIVGGGRCPFVKRLFLARLLDALRTRVQRSLALGDLAS
jgi:hypothetical protein